MQTHKVIVSKINLLDSMNNLNIKVLFKLSFHWCLADLFDTKAFLSSK
jgi:hypothetical protein